MSSPSRWIAHSSRGEHSSRLLSFFCSLTKCVCGTFTRLARRIRSTHWCEVGRAHRYRLGAFISLLIVERDYGLFHKYLTKTNRTHYWFHHRPYTGQTPWLRGQIHSIGSGHYLWYYGLRNMVYVLISMDYRLRTPHINKTLQNEQNPTDIGSKNEERSRQYIHLSIYHLPYIIYHFLSITLHF